MSDQRNRHVDEYGWGVEDSTPPPSPSRWAIPMSPTSSERSEYQPNNFAPAVEQVRQDPDISTRTPAAQDANVAHQATTNDARRAHKRALERERLARRQVFQDDNNGQYESDDSENDLDRQRQSYHVNTQLQQEKDGKFFKPEPFPSGLPIAKRFEAWLMWKRQLRVSLDVAGRLSQQKMASFAFMSGGPEIEAVIHAKGLFPEPSDVGDDFPFYDHLMAGLHDHYKSSSDSTVDMTALLSMRQEPKEAVSDFLLRLLRQAVICGKNTDDQLIRSRLLLGMSDKAVAMDGFSYSRTVEEIVDAASRNESAAAATMTSAASVADVWGTPSTSTAGVSAVVARDQRYQPHRPRAAGGKRYDGQRQGARKSSGPYDKRAPKPDEQCKSCGIKQHRFGTCPAVGKPCLQCGELGHFKRVCPKRVNVLQAAGEEVID